uniref:ABI family member 3 binding protein n=1 Tax=Saimiri boliviensis boliviensis TaxID=39432 RepID=A0A2K6STV2_SAIBB
VRGGKCNMLSSLGCLLLCGSITLVLGNAQKLPKGKRPSLKVHINTTSDSIFLKFLRPSPNVKLEGLLLGYGSNVSPNQYFPLPAEGKFTEAIVDAEPKYLIVVRPAPPPSQKKSCSGKARSRKPLQLVVGTLTPSSVFLSWGFLINPHHDWTLPSHCPNDRFYTIRYREKDKEKKWIFQICPATETIVENLKPNTVYEFGVKDNVEGGIWSKIFNHKTVVGSKKVNGKIQSTYDQDHTVPAYVPRKLIPITIIKQAKNETLALPAESKTPEVEKIPARPTAVTPETVPRSAKPTVPGAFDVSETTLVLSKRTPETLQTIRIPQFELPLSTLVPKRLPEFPEAKTPFPFEKPGGTLASSEKPWIVPTAKTSDDSKVLQPQTATYDVSSSPMTSEEPGISESYTATSDRILDSVPPKTSRTLEQPRATLAPSETPFVPQNLEIFTSPETQPTTPAPQQTTSIPSTPKRRPRPKPPRTKPERTTSAGTITPKISKSPESTWTTPAPSKTQSISLKPKIPLSPEVTHTKPAPEPQTPLPSESTIGPETLGTKPSTTTLAPRKTKRPGRRPRPRPRPKTTPSPDVPTFKPALEPVTIPPEPLVPTIASKPSESPKTTHRPDAPQIQPGSKPPKQLLPKPQTTAEPDMPPTKSVSGPVPFETEAPSMTIVPTTDIEPVTLRTEAPVTTLAPKTPPRARTRRPRPKHKTTPRPETPQTKLDFGPITPGTSSAPTTKRARRPHPKPKTTPRPDVPQTKLATKTSKRTRPPRPRVKTTRSPQAPETKPVPATVLEPVTLRPEAPTTLASKTSQRTRRPRLRTKTTPRPEAPESKPVPTAELKPETLRTETWVTTQAPKTSQRTRRPRPKPKTTPSLEVPQTKPVPVSDLEPVTLRTEAPKTMVVTTGLEPDTFRTKVPETTLAPKAPRTRRPRPRPKTTPEVPQTKSGKCMIPWFKE